MGEEGSRGSGRRGGYQRRDKRGGEGNRSIKSLRNAECIGKIQAVYSIDRGRSVLF